VFSAIAGDREGAGKFHLSAIIGCHLFSTLPPSTSHTVLGTASGSLRTRRCSDVQQRTVTMMGDGASGITAHLGIANTVFNKNDGIWSS